MSYSSFAAGSEASHFNSSQMNGATSETMSSTYVAPPAEKKKKKHKDRNGDKKKKKSKQKKRESSASEALVADLDAWEEGNRVPPDEWVRPRNAEIAITEVSPTRLRSAVRSRTVEENMELSPQQEDVEISLQSEGTLQESFAEEWNAALASVASQQANEETFGN
jgi:Ni/Co efflux regulator RcnB